MSHLREHWEGVSISGDYTLEQWLGGDDSAAFFQTSLAPDGRRAVVKLIPEAVVDGAAPLDLWHRTRQLRHPNLIELLDCGRADHGGEIVLYAVFESPDDTLASALSRSPLNQVESREVLDSVLNALRYLHAQGLVLGALGPDRIVAVGDRVKLSTDALREADTSSAYGNDVRLLGELWQQALMAASPKSSEIAAHAADPNPQARWTLAEISAALDAAPPCPPTPRCLTPVSVPSTMTSLPCRHSIGAPQTCRLIPRPEMDFRGRRRSPVTHPRSQSTAPRRYHGIPSCFGLARLPVETPVRAPLPKTAVPKLTVADAYPSRAPAAGKEMWRVIAFTYRTRDAADKKVQQLNEHHPGLNATVFSPNDKAGYYLVSLGGRLTHEEAVRLQRSARGKGLPRDLYVQNYSR